jgi:hypothetical protein
MGSGLGIPNSLRKQNFLISVWAWKGKAATAQRLWLWSMLILTHTTIN